MGNNMYGSSSVQFYGNEAVMEAVKNRRCPYWALWQGRQFLFKCEEADIKSSLDYLDQLLQMLNNDTTTATYTLKFFEPEGKGAVKIKENTPSDGSFNFKLVEPEAVHQRQIGFQSNTPKVLELLEKMSLRLDAIENAGIDGEEEEEEEETIEKAIIGVLKDPNKLEKYITMGKNFFGVSTPEYVGNVNRLGQIGDPGQAGHQAPVTNLSQSSGDNEEQFLIRVGNALDILKAHDPQIADHLEKLASMAKNNPGKFQSMLSMLNLL